MQGESRTASKAKGAPAQRTSRCWRRGDGGGFGAGVAQAAPTDIYRFYHLDAGRHFYTASVAERDKVLNLYPRFAYEGPVFQAYLTQEAGTVPVYRFYHQGNGSHVYTASETEKSYILLNYPIYAYEGIAQRTRPSKPGRSPFPERRYGRDRTRAASRTGAAAAPARRSARAPRGCSRSPCADCRRCAARGGSALTMEPKSSSSRTRADASRATSVPRPPIAMPMWAALSAGASLTPSPVMATTSPLALKRLDDAQFLLGHDRGRKRVDVADPAAQLRVVQRVELVAGEHRRRRSIPAWRGDRPRRRRVVAGDHDDADAGAAAFARPPPARRRAAGSAKPDQADETRTRNRAGSPAGRSPVERGLARRRARACRRAAIRSTLRRTAGPRLPDRAGTGRRSLPARPWPRRRSRPPPAACQTCVIASRSGRSAIVAHQRPAFALAGARCRRLARRRARERLSPSDRTGRRAGEDAAFDELAKLLGQARRRPDHA